MTINNTAMTIGQANGITAYRLSQDGFTLTLTQIAIRMALQDGATLNEAERALLRINIDAFARNVSEYIAGALSLKVINARYQIFKEQKERQQK